MAFCGKSGVLWAAGGHDKNLLFILAPVSTHFAGNVGQGVGW